MDETTELRRRLFANIQTKTVSHTTACSIWGDDGKGSTREGFPQPLPCNCGALLNYVKEELGLTTCAEQTLLDTVSAQNMEISHLRDVIDRLERKERT